MSLNSDLSYAFASFVVNSDYSDLPESAIEAAKKSVLDTLGVIIAASGIEPAVEGVVDLVKEMGGASESSIFGFGGTAPALMSAFANGAMAHCLDFDDHAPEGHHPSSSIIPAAFALAERKGGVSGQDMVTAIAVGHDLFLRLRRNVGWKQDWHLTTVIGIFSATAACAKILRLNEEQTVNAFGIAGMQSSGTMELAYGVGSDLRGMYAGFTSKGAVLAALMAEKGISGTKSIFEGKAGIFNTYFGGEYSRNRILDGLGEVYDGGSILYKPWPSCGATHPYIHATLEVMKENSLRIDDVREIRVYVGDFQKQLCEPLEARRKPSTFVDAKFSIPFVVAIAATRGQLRVSDFTNDTLNDSEILRAADKVIPIFDDAYNWDGKLPDGRVEILTNSGQIFSRVGNDVPGGQDTPMTWDYLYQKFENALSVAAKQLTADAVLDAKEIIRKMDNVKDVTRITSVLTP